MNFTELLVLTVDADLVLISPTKTPQISNSVDPPELLPVDVMIPSNRTAETPFFHGFEEGDGV